MVVSFVIGVKFTSLFLVGAVVDLVLLMVGGSRSLLPQTPTATNSSVVNVPVLSKRHASNLPAIGTLYGSVQKTCIFINVIKLLFTAIAICIGNSGGMTLVTIKIQCNNNSYCDRF